MNRIPLDAFKNIMSFLDPRWGIDDGSYHREILEFISFQRHFEIHRRLLKCVELWWRKTQFNIIIRECRIPVHEDDHFFVHAVVSLLWEERCWKISEKQIHAIQDTGKKWYHCEQCHFFPHSINDDGERFDNMNAWGL